jgi:diguanylate cyclase (GGDEF)-like protein
MSGVNMDIQLARLDNALKRYVDFLEHRGKSFNFAVGLICIALLGIVDYFTVDKFKLTLFYQMPISIVAWLVGRKAGIALAFVSTLTWMVANNYTTIDFLTMWKVFTSLGFFLVVSILFSKLKQMFDNEQKLSQTDHLTGVVNRRAFLHILSNEILRQGRNNLPLTLAYIDLDNFKEINDDFGHAKGDLILHLVADTLAKNLRKTDKIARLGGDEFAILLPETDMLAAQAVIPKVQEILQERTKQDKLMVTLSIGVLTCPHTPRSADEMLKLADNLMYEVKKSGKNGVRYAVYHEQLQLSLGLYVN